MGTALMGGRSARDLKSELGFLFCRESIAVRTHRHRNPTFLKPPADVGY